MLLTFSKPEFETLIKQGVKIHTIRADKHNRWKVGTKIHFWRGNPRNTRGKHKPYQFGVGEVSRIEEVRIELGVREDFTLDTVYIGNDIVLKTIDELNQFAINDGFKNWWHMSLWFDNIEKQFIGKIIYWKNFNKVI